MDLSTGWVRDGLLLVARVCLALVFAASAVSKFRRDPAEIKMIAGLHIPAPATAELLVGVCEAIGVFALVFGLYARFAALLLAVFILAVSFVVLSFWSPGVSPPERAQKLNAFVANIAIVGGLICLVVAGTGRFALEP